MPYVEREPSPFYATKSPCCLPAYLCLTRPGAYPIVPSTLPTGEGALVSRLSMTQNPLQTLPHPFESGAALLAVGVGSPGLLLLELLAKSEPRVVLRAPMPGHMPVLGVGLLQVTQWESLGVQG